jgi:integrase
MLTAVRSIEVRGASWDEIDMHEAVWSIPATRMKTRKEHRIPLSSAALVILQRMAEIRSGDLVFPGAKRNQLLSDITLKDQLRQLGLRGLTVHGFRSSFRDWCGETGRPHDAAEIALAHAVGTTVTRSYARSDLLELRRPLMQAWANFLMDAVVVPLRAVG